MQHSAISGRKRSVAVCHQRLAVVTPKPYPSTQVQYGYMSVTTGTDFPISMPFLCHASPATSRGFQTRVRRHVPCIVASCKHYRSQHVLRDPRHVHIWKHACCCVRVHASSLRRSQSADCAVRYRKGAVVQIGFSSHYHEPWEHHTTSSGF